jgi:tRNA threonylcarbamoyladenosine biosynthesis protein TsaB
MKNKYSLNLDTTDIGKTTVSLIKDSVKIIEIIKDRRLTSQVVLPLIDEIMKKEKIGWNQICDINIINRPGSYTGLRVGFSIANILGWLFNIPINGKKYFFSEINYNSK